MHLDFIKPGVARVDLSEYVDKILEDFPEVVIRSSPVSQLDILFKVNNAEAVISP
jgi:hypothetical protein